MCRMETTTIEVSKESWKQLNQQKEPGESFDDVIQRKVINNGENQ